MWVTAYPQTALSALRAILVRERTDNLIVGVCDRKGAGEGGTRWHGRLHVSEGRVGGMCFDCIGRCCFTQTTIRNEEFTEHREDRVDGA
jgi:hypothetical protein